MANRPSGDDPSRPGTLNIDEAHRRIAATVVPVTAVETVRLPDASGRVLAVDVHSPIDIPPVANAEMDGFALRAADLDASGAAELRLVGTAWAGHALDVAVGAGECVRIMTGAPVPAGADTVVMLEQASSDGDRVRVRGAEPGGSIRRPGEDIADGELALAAGTLVRPAEVGVLASLGMTELAVLHRPRVALFATGDEITEPGQPLRPGRLYDSNRYTVHAMLDRLGMIVDDRGHLPDEREAVEASLLAAAAEADAVITTGGVSVGEADHVSHVLQARGDVGFWELAVRPGRPLNFGCLDRALFFGLPGNPVSAMVTFSQFVRPALRRLAGAPYARPLSLRARAVVALSKKPGRTEFQRAVLTVAPDGTPEVGDAGPRDSARLSSMSRSNCLVILPADSADVRAGAWVDVQPFDGLF